MFAANLLRVITYAGAAAVLIFSQNHSLVLGVNILLFLATSLGLGGFALLLIPNIRASRENLIAPSLVSVLIFMFGLDTWYFHIDATAQNLYLLNTLLALIIGALAVTELVQSFIDTKEDVLELRISAGIGIVFALVLGLAQLDVLNALGTLSAYLAISAVQRAVWIATAKTGKN
jgi:hypothetical protein